MVCTKKNYLTVIALITSAIVSVNAQLIKPCQTATDKFTGKTSKFFFTTVSGFSIVSGGVFDKDTLFTITLSGAVASANAEKFSSSIGDSCIIIHRSGERTRLIAKTASEYSQTARLLACTYYIDLTTLQDFIKDPPTDIGIFGKPYHIPIPIAKYEQKLIPKAITCFLQL
jgi:hypothetical protein